jgi:hypothetical protein
MNELYKAIDRLKKDNATLRASKAELLEALEDAADCCIACQGAELPQTGELMRLRTENKTLKDAIYLVKEAKHGGSK